MSPVYASAALSKLDFGLFRLLGPGLGNLLWPWARMIVFARTHDLMPIWPTWPQVKVGPWLRMEPDKRFYAGLFRPTDGYVHGVRKAQLLLSLPRIPESQLAGEASLVLPAGDKAIVEFSGMRGRFADIAGHHELVLAELLAITRDKHKKAAERLPQGAVALHIRRGDFLPSQDAALRQGQPNTQVPVQWYVDTVESLRERLQRVEPVYLFSNGSNEELREVLQLPQVHRVSGGSAVGDIVALSRSSLLVGSSVFSRWASYLGQMPAVWYPGQLSQRLYTQDKRSLEIERDYGQSFTDEFVAAFESRRAGRERTIVL